MKRKQAIRIALEAMQDAIQHIAFDANLHDLLHSDFPYSERASKKRKKLQEAMEVLKEIRDD